jgi:hypothetical protein
MNDDLDAAADRAAIAARRAVKAQEQQQSRSFLPLIMVAVAILSGVYLFMSESNRTADPTTSTPAPHVQTPTISPPPVTPNNN